MIPVIKNKTIKNITWNLKLKITKNLNRLKRIKISPKTKKENLKIRHC